MPENYQLAVLALSHFGLFVAGGVIGSSIREQNFREVLVSFMDGARSKRKGATLNENPWPPGGWLHRAWEAGHRSSV